MTSTRAGFHRLGVAQVFKRIAVVNRGEPALRLIRAVRELNEEHGYGIRVIALHTEAERRAMFVRAADEAVVLRDAGTGSPTSTTRSSSGRCGRAAPTRCGSAGASSRRTRRSPSCARGWASRSSARRRRPCACSATRSRRSCSPRRPVFRSRRGAGVRSRPSRTACGTRQSIGYPLIIKARSGGGGRGIRMVRVRGRAGGRVRAHAGRGRATFGDAGRLHGAAGRRRPAHRGAGHRRQPRQRVGAGRARLLDPAAQPEADRGVRLPGAHRGAGADAARVRRSRWSAAGYRGAGTVEYLYQPEREAVHVPRGQHPAAGRAPGHRGHHRARPGQAADPRRRGRAGSRATRPAEFGHAVEARLNAEDADAGLRARPRHRRASCACPPARASASTPASPSAT